MKGREEEAGGRNQAGRVVSPPFYHQMLSNIDTSIEISEIFDSKEGWG